MFDVGPSELLLIVVVAVVVIGPKDLPRALYKIGQVIGKAKGMARHFRTGVDAMIREAELEELQKQWARENERIMAATALPELDGVMTPLTDETGQPIAAAAPSPSPEGEPSVDGVATDALADAAPMSASSEEIGSTAARTDQPSLPLDGAPDEARGGSSGS
ncbi:MAG TPA: Sec-independent protein translocase protein TatB [Sphingobium sp.]|nr:Sec-independent protein translocase protein TatB [Sphingobium sp.]